MKLIDKDIHCIARHLQDVYIGKAAYSACHYCKYSIECAEKVRKDRENGERVTSYFVENAMPKLERITGCIVLRMRIPDKDCLAGSWIENFPDLKKVITRKSFAERLDILCNKNIFTYARNPSPDNLQTLLKNQP